MKKNYWFIFIVLVFLFSHFLGLGQIYHQDEYKWAMIVNPVFGLESASNHPPLVALLYRLTGQLFGYDHLRILSLVFGALTLALAFLLAQKLYGRRAAILTGVFLLVSVYNFIASLQIDIDGALLPFFGLAAVYAFYQIDFSSREKNNYLWGGILLLAIVGGFLVKLSFILWLAALATEYFLLYRPRPKTWLKLAAYFGGAVLLTGLVVFLINAFFPLAQVSRFLLYVKNFPLLNLADRHWGQVGFLTLKSLLLASPLLLGGYLLLDRGWRRYRFWLIFLIYNLLFYLVIFDFSSRTIERYFMFLIIPSAIIGGSLIADELAVLKTRRFWLKLTAAILVLAGGAWFLLNQPARVLPLIPKTAYLAQLKTFNFNFLIPITGGSGPIGFYVLASLALSFFAVAFLAILVFRLVKKSSFKQWLLIIFLAVGLIYNVVLDAEFLSGWFYGQADVMAKKALNFVIANSEIKEAITYYDTGGYELNISGKYSEERRFYTNEMFQEENQQLFDRYKGYYLVVDFPKIAEDSFYWQHFNACRTDFSVSDKKISAYVFDCRSGKSNSK